MSMNDIKTSTKKRIPICPLLSMGTVESKLCEQDNCAWWSNNTDTCIASIFAHDLILNIKQKRGK